MFLFIVSFVGEHHCAKQGGKLQGNSTRKLLKCVDSLELELRKISAEAYCEGLPFIRALRAFNMVVHSCFGQILLEGWEQTITEFTLAYTALQSSNGRPISITPKV